MFDIFNTKKIKELEERIKELEERSVIEVSDWPRREVKVSVKTVVFEILDHLRLKLEYHPAKSGYPEIVKKK